MIKEITANEKEQRKIDIQIRNGQYPAFASLGERAISNRLKLTEISNLHNPGLKSSVFTTIGVSSGSL